MATTSGFYAGSQLLYPLASAINVPVDQLNYFVSQIACVGFGCLLRKRFSVTNVSADVRYGLEAILGFIVLVFCFGYQIMHLFFHAGVTYLLMRFDRNAKRMSLLAFAFTMGHLSVCHLLRQIYDYGGYTLDITGALMIQTQKLSSLACAYADGQRVKSNPAYSAKLNEHQRRDAITSLPAILPYVSYCFYFHGALLGPYVSFIQFTNFIESRQLAELLQDSKVTQALHRRIVRCLFKGLIFLSLQLFVARHFNASTLEGPDVQSMSFVAKLVYFYFFLSVFRYKYYFAWSITEVANLAAGFGYSGFNEKTKRHEWILCKNFDWVHTEFGNSLKVVLDSWNMSTARWLRETLYDRLPTRYRMIGVYVANSMWHGFYPGYYLVFLSIALFTEAARVVRKVIRPMFVPNSAPNTKGIFSPNWREKSTSHLVYDILTTITACCALAYVMSPFLILELYRSIAVWQTLNYYMHIASVLVLLLLPRIARAYRGSAKQRTNTDDSVADVSKAKQS